MIVILPRYAETVAQLREISVERQRILKKLVKLNDREVDLFDQLQEQVKRTNIEPPDFPMFKETTRRLLTEFWNAPDHMLSHEDIRQDVIYDEEANDGTIWQVVSRANSELVKTKSHFEIKNIKKRGYQLAIKNLTKHKNAKKPMRNMSCFVRVMW